MRDETEFRMCNGASQNLSDKKCINLKQQFSKYDTVDPSSDKIESHIILAKSNSLMQPGHTLAALTALCL